MTSHELPVQVAINSWRLVLERANKTLSNLAEDQLLKEVAPGRNRLIYLWGHLTAVHDARFPILGLEERLSEKSKSFSAIAAGNANKLIADKLSITEETVKGTRQEYPLETWRKRPNPRGHYRAETGNHRTVAPRKRCIPAPVFGDSTGPRFP